MSKSPDLPPDHLHRLTQLPAVSATKLAEPNLDALTRQFDEMFSRMQGADAAVRMAEAFSMTPAQLGEAAVREAK